MSFLSIAVVVALGNLPGVSANSSPGPLTAVQQDKQRRRGNQARTTYVDPIAYCRAAGTVDRPGPRYRSEETPAWLRRRMGATEDYETLSWRCRNGQMLACLAVSMHGTECAAPITSRVGDAALREYCTIDPNSSFIPNSHARYHLHEWGCRRGRPFIIQLNSTQALDDRGFWREAWRVVTR